ncbi:LIC_20245 family lipoprotein [Leptospira idonii]|uniref:Uncharacterized protein n=1 Tax=Leptospira idonii TaxID=1193500 RepID=A0A4R9M2D6_9LEPT|nr:hypothetical protein [Leptospira idonii]TGN20131.1 hypothetical protein EHS15_05400 [Leptospira idonii]
MGIQKKLLFTSFILLVLFFITILFLFVGDDDEEERRRKSGKSKAISALFMGDGGSKRPTSNALGARGQDSESIFDSDYYKAGGMTYEDEVRNSVANSGEIPINPATGKPYPEEAMETFDELREMFPDNNLIPRRMTAEVKAKMEQENQRLSQATTAVFGGSPSAGDLQYYYTSVKKQGNDRLEIINYLIESNGGDDPEMDKKFEEILTNIKFQNEQVDREMAAAYQRAGIPTP